MRILFVLAHPIPSPSAAWTRIGFFAEFFKKRGNQIFVSGASNFPPLKKTANTEKGIPLLRTTYTLPFWKNPLISLLSTGIHFVCLSPLLVILRPKVVIVSVPPIEPCLGLFITSRIARCRFIVDYRDESEDYLISISNSKLCRKAFQFIKSLMGAIYKKSELVTAVTPNFVYNLKCRGVTNVRLVPNGADVAVFRQHDKHTVRKKLALTNSDFVIVYSGHIGGYYKLDVIIRALAKLNGKIISIKLIMIGDGPDVQFVLGLAKKLGLRDKVLYLGIKNDKNEIAEILSAADVGIIPGLYSRGQLPVKAFEYFACGIPIVAAVYEDSLLATLIREYGIGLTSSPIDEKKLAEAIYRIYKDKSFREAAGKRARALVEEKFDRTKIAGFFLKLIEAI